MKTKKSTTSTLKRCPAGSRRDKTTRECVPTGKTPNIKPAKTPSLPKDVREEIKKIEEFTPLYQKEKDHLVTNVRNSHKRGTLTKLFSSAKGALSGLLRLMKSPYFIIIVCVALAYFTGMTPSKGQAIAIEAFNKIQSSSIGSYIGGGMAKLPGGFKDAKQFVMTYWNTFADKPGIKKFFESMSGLMVQLQQLVTKEKLGFYWTATIGTIMNLYTKLIGAINTYIPAASSLSSITSLTQKYSSLTPYQQQSLKDGGTLAASIGLGSSLGYIFGYRKPVKPVVAPKKR